MEDSVSSSWQCLPSGGFLDMMPWLETRGEVFWKLEGRCFGHDAMVGKSSGHDTQIPRVKFFGVTFFFASYVVGGFTCMCM